MAKINQDGKTYSLSELISEYESEEKEMKSKQELIEKWESAIEAADFYGKGKEGRLIGYMRDFVGDLKQLKEPKALSQEEIDQAYKDGYEKGKQHTFYKGYLEGLADKGSEPETVADLVTTFLNSYERLEEVMSMEVGGAGRMKEYKPRKGFFDISDRPKGLSEVKHRKMQETQTPLQRTEDRKEYYLKHDHNSWELAKETSAQLQQLIFKYYPKILVEEPEE